MDNLVYLLAAFVLIWGVLFGYLFLLNARLGRLSKEIKALEQGTRSGPSAP